MLPPERVKVIYIPNGKEDSEDPVPALEIWWRRVTSTTGDCEYTFYHGYLQYGVGEELLYNAFYSHEIARHNQYRIYGEAGLKLRPAWVCFTNLLMNLHWCQRKMRWSVMTTHALLLRTEDKIRKRERRHHCTFQIKPKNPYKNRILKIKALNQITFEKKIGFYHPCLSYTCLTSLW